MIYALEARSMRLACPLEPDLLMGKEEIRLRSDNAMHESCMHVQGFMPAQPETFLCVLALQRMISITSSEDRDVLREVNTNLSKYKKKQRRNELYVGGLDHHIGCFRLLVR